LIEFVETGGEIRDLAFSGTVDADDRSRAGASCVGSPGGLVGTHFAGSIIDSYARSQAIDSPNAGGLVGFASGTGLVISTSYAFPSSLAGAGAQGLVGLVETGTVPAITACYFHDSATGSLGVPLTTSEMRSESSFVGWDFDTVWQMDPSISPYPSLRYQTAP